MMIRIFIHKNNLLFNLENPPKLVCAIPLFLVYKDQPLRALINILLCMPHALAWFWKKINYDKMKGSKALRSARIANAKDEN